MGVTRLSPGHLRPSESANESVRYTCLICDQQGLFYMLHCSLAHSGAIYEIIVRIDVRIVNPIHNFVFTNMGFFTTRASRPRLTPFSATTLSKTSPGTAGRSGGRPHSTRSSRANTKYGSPTMTRQSKSDRGPRPLQQYLPPHLLRLPTWQAVARQYCNALQTSSVK